MSEKKLKTNDAHITINVQGDPGELYEIFNSKTGDVLEIFFHKEEGITHEILLAILLDRLGGLCTKYEKVNHEEPHEETQYDIVIYHLAEAIQELGYMGEALKVLRHVKDCVNGKV